MHQDIYDIILFLSSQRPASRDMMPFFETATATASRGMLGDEDRRSTMTHRSLLAIIRDDGRSQSLGDDLMGMLTNRRQTFIGYDVPVFLIQVKATSEF